MKSLINFPFENVLVLGLAKSGTAAANLLLDSNIKVIVNDFKSDENSTEVVELKNKGASIVLGSHPLSIIENIDLIVKNPGISYENPILKEALKRNIPIVTEIELAFYLSSQNDIIGITGSNGKTTTVSLVAEILKKSSQPVKLAGNIGVVATDQAREMAADDKLLLELSSFQLMGIQKFKPHIAALLNLFEAHLDYHGTFEAYAEAKSNIFKHQDEDDVLVYNADDENVTALVRTARSELIPFSLKTKQINGGWTDGKAAYFKDQKIIDLTEIRLVGEHNLANILAAISIAITAGATIEAIKEVLKTFSGVEHRLQFVDEVAGRVYYNDSKATNMLATEKALQSFNQPVILLAGGLDRGDEYDALIPYLKNVKAMILFGETKHKLKKIADQLDIKTYMAENITDAVPAAHELSAAGDVVLLSPACASWDQYKTFEERGNMFVQSVHILQ